MSLSGQSYLMYTCLLVTCSLVVMSGSVVAAPATEAASDYNNMTTSAETDGHPPARLEELNGTETVVVRLHEPEPEATTTATRSDRKQSDSTREIHAATTQSPLVDYIETQPALSIERRFWITNAVVISVGANPPPIEDLYAIDNVTAVHRNIELGTTPASSAITSDTADGATTTHSDTGGSYTDNVARTHAPAVWNRYGTQGGSVQVAVLDTGVAPDHPDLSITSSNWAEFGPNGSSLRSAPYDDNGHGTHVSGLVAGGNASGKWIGTAPNATLLHGKVLDSTGAGTFAQLVAGLEWAIEAKADVVIMSFGVEDKSAPFVTPIANAEEVGVPVVASVGNDGVNTSSSPANVYESIAVGAINESDSVPVFSSGERINTTAEWKDPPARWPPEYTVPDVVAPGTNIMSSYTDGGYRRLTGTSMSAPHVGGVLALLLSAVDGELTPGHLREWLTTAADTPPPDSADPTRSGAGIVNASALLATPNDPVGSVQYPPRDLDFDGRYEDVNGDGEFTVVDVSAFFKNYRGVTVQSNPTIFDFNADGVVTIVDVSRLFLSLA